MAPSHSNNGKGCCKNCVMTDWNVCDHVGEFGDRYYSAVLGIIIKQVREMKRNRIWLH